jgi:hypothetical protein
VHESRAAVLIADDGEAVSRLWREACADDESVVVLSRDANRRFSWPRAQPAYLLFTDRAANIVAEMGAAYPGAIPGILSSRPSTSAWLDASRRRVLLIPQPDCVESCRELLRFLMENQHVFASLRMQLGTGAGTDARFVGALRQKEQALVRLLMARNGAITSASDLARALLDREDVASLDVTRRHVANVRRAIGRDVIETIPGFGYCWRGG